MPLPRAFALMQTADQWLRAFHEHTALESGVLQLALLEDEAVADGVEMKEPAVGLAFDRYCRLYATRADGRIQRELWAASQPGEALDLLGMEPSGVAGDFGPTAGVRPAPRAPRGIVVDADDRLFVADASSSCVFVFDLWSGRLLRRVTVPGRPVDLVPRGSSALVLIGSPARLMSLEAHTGPRLLTLPPGVANPGRLAVSAGGDVFVLDEPRTASARVVSTSHVIPVPFATDLEWLPHDVLVVARGPRQDLRRFHVSAAAIQELSPLKARGYDGLGIVRTPDDRIGFFTAQGFRHAVTARARYRSQGRAVTYRLDSGEFGTVWGRLFLDACIPGDTSLRVSYVTSDSPPEDEDTLPRRLPDNVTNAVVVRPDLSPPMPPLSMTPGHEFRPPHRRDSGRELPFGRRAADDPFRTYEAPIDTAPGRYLWVALELAGNRRFTPRVRSLRAEYPSHDYLRRLPKVFSREPQQASFLRRYLAMFDGFLGDLDARSMARHALLDPASTPSAALAWLAGFMGLVLDERWPTHVQRAVLAEVAWLFRFRGTVRGLTRFIELYVERQVIVVEKFRLRGLGSVADSVGPESRAILGAGFRVGGALGDDEFAPVTGSVEDAFDTHAHRFTVMIPAVLTSEQLDVVGRILDLHRPAHTLVEVCTVEAGMRVGRGLHIGLTSTIGRSGGFSTIQTGAPRLGRESIVGRPLPGARLESSRLGFDSRVG